MDSKKRFSMPSTIAELTEKKKISLDSPGIIHFSGSNSMVDVVIFRKKMHEILTFLTPFSL